MAFPPSGGPAGPPPPRSLRDVRRSVGTTPPPDEVKPKDSVTVSMTCKSCGAPVEQTFGGVSQADDTGLGAPPAPSGGPMGPGGL